MRMTTIWMALALAMEEGWTMYQMDMKFSFLGRNIEEEVYIEKPPYFVILNFESKLC